jgi:GNAT superfamily N-acetyltransferase
MTTALSIVPATPERWADLADLFRSEGDAAGCWCAWFRMPNTRFGPARVAGRRQALDDLVAADARPGLLAYAEEQAVGWVSIVPRPTLERIEPPDHPRLYTEVGAIWAITCFVVRPGQRRLGVAGSLLDAAVAHARDAGASIIEAYPVEVARSASSAFTGVVSMYRRRGFEETGRFDRWSAVPAASGPEPRRIGRPPGRPVMRLAVR